MTDLLEGNGGDAPADGEVTPFADPAPPQATPLILTDAYVEINGVNLRCLTSHIELTPAVKMVTITTMCSETDYPGQSKWSFKATIVQSFDTGATDATLSAAVAAYKTAGTLCPFKLRPFSSRPVSATNPEFDGLLVPVDYSVFAGDAGAASEVQIDWSMPAPPTRNTAAVAATGATAGTPGSFTPLGCTRPANLAALSTVTASPLTAWVTGQYVVTADLIGAHWSGSAWVAGVTP